MAKNEKLRESVKARSKIQFLLLDLYDFLEEHQENLANNDRDRFCIAFTLIMGAGFSLWRAAFLTQDERHRDTIIAHARGFLRFLVRDNAINYPQDRETQAWSAMYYMNSANLKLLHLAEVFPEIVRDPSADEKKEETYRKSLVAGTSWSIGNRKPSERMWIECFEEVDRIFKAFKLAFEAECGTLSTSTAALMASPAVAKLSPAVRAKKPKLSIGAGSSPLIGAQSRPLSLTA